MSGLWAMSREREMWVAGGKFGIEEAGGLGLGMLMNTSRRNRRSTLDKNSIRTTSESKKTSWQDVDKLASATIRLRGSDGDLAARKAGVTCSGCPAGSPSLNPRLCDYFHFFPLIMINAGIQGSARQVLATICKLCSRRSSETS